MVKKRHHYLRLYHFLSGNSTDLLQKMREACYNRYDFMKKIIIDYRKEVSMERTFKQKTYIIGHKNPDTDSICSAIAYAELKNKLDQIQ